MRAEMSQMDEQLMAVRRNFTAISESESRVEVGMKATASTHIFANNL